MSTKILHVLINHLFFVFGRRTNIQRLEDSGKVNSILLVHSNKSDVPPDFSPDGTCPNQEFSKLTCVQMMQKALWAKPPELFFNGYLSFHIFNLHVNRYVFGPCRISTLSERHVEWAWQCSNVWRPQDSICCSNQGWWSSGLDQRCKFCLPTLQSKRTQNLLSVTARASYLLLSLIQCYLEHNEPRSDGSARDYPLCSVEVKVDMDGAVDTETCIRRSTLFNSLTPREWCCDVTQAIIWHHVNDNDTVGFMIMLAILWLSRRIEKCAFMWCLTEVYCDPLGSYSVFGFVRPGFREEEEDLQDGELIMASARVHETCL